MAKNMALIENGIVTNILWCSGDEPEEDTLVDVGERRVRIGDTWESGKFFRNGEEVLSPLEKAKTENAMLTAENATLAVALDELDAEYQKGVDSL